MQEAICEYCDKKFSRIQKFKGRHKYCSNPCRIKGQSIFHDIKHKGKYLICPICKKSFYVWLGQINKRKFCSYNCHNKAMEKAESKILLKCHYCGKNYEQYVSYLKIRKSKYCSKKCQDSAAELRTGEKSFTWKGGLSQESKRIRSSARWERWRKEIFKRDNWTCQFCYNRSSINNPVELHPHHIKSFKDYPELRFDINNGITLCSICHYKFHGILNIGIKKTHKYNKTKNEKIYKELSKIF